MMLSGGQGYKMFAIIIYHLSRMTRKIPFLMKLFKQLNVALNALDISSRAEIETGLNIVHGVGTEIGPSKIGKNVSIYQNVTIGGKTMGKNKGFPTIENNVKIYPGAIVVGKITVGHDSIIGAGTYVDRDIPPYSTVYSKQNLTIKKR